MILPARRIKAPEGTDILYLMPGDCQAYFNNILYSVDVVANGVLYSTVKKVLRH